MWSEVKHIFFCCAKKEKDYATLKESIKTYIYFATYIFFIPCCLSMSIWLLTSIESSCRCRSNCAVIYCLSTFVFFCFSTLDRGPLWALLSTSTATCACQARVLLPYDFFVALFFYFTFSRLQIVLCWALLHCYGRECYWVLGGELICCFCCCFFTTLHFIKRGEHTLAASRRVSTCSVEVEKFNSELNSVAWRSRVDGLEVSV